jgi:hypothetical protein
VKPEMKGCLRLFFGIWLVLAAGSPGCGRSGIVADSPAAGSIHVRVQLEASVTGPYNIFQLTWAGTFLNVTAVDTYGAESATDTLTRTPSQVAEAAGLIEFDTRGSLRPGEWEMSVVVTGLTSSGSVTIQSHLCTPEIISDKVILVQSTESEPTCFWSFVPDG